MKRQKTGKILSLLLTFPLLLAGCSGGTGANQTENRQETSDTGSSISSSAAENPLPTKSGEGSLSLLRVENGQLTDANGKTVVLHGVNLGGWLIQESWMCPVDGSECNLDSWTLLESRFGAEKAAALFESYAENYICEDDIKKIAALGCNCVRLPFWYRNFMNEDGSFLSENPDEILGFQVIDRLLSWCETYGIYVILDLHGAPGGQSTNHCCGSIGRCGLYTDEDAKAATVRLWTAIAERYKDSSAVAAYDLLNEPMNNDGNEAPSAGSAEAIRLTNEIYDLLYKAIRQVDPVHVISVEGIWSTACLPNPADYGWENMLYQLHLYDTSKDMIDYRVAELKAVQEKYGVAIYVGEFNNGDENQKYAYEAYCEAGISRTMWTYKVGRGNLGNWGLYSANAKAPDLANDSYENILKYWSTSLRTVRFTENTTVSNYLKKYAPEQE
ncbi:MAG: glycoside hydrolase family 5 protein [Eubacteriales bacterium]